VVPSFRVPFLLDMSSSTTPRRLHEPSFFPADDGLRPMTIGSATPWSHNPFHVGDQFRSFNTVQFRYNLSSCLPPDGSDRAYRPANGDFYFRASGDLIARRAAGYDYVATGKFHRRVFHPLECSLV
jgi:hypothetical protein